MLAIQNLQGPIGKTNSSTDINIIFNETNFTHLNFRVNFRTFESEIVVYQLISYRKPNFTYTCKVYKLARPVLKRISLHRKINFTPISEFEENFRKK
jgi:hypothetical protein